MPSTARRWSVRTRLARRAPAFATSSSTCIIGRETIAALVGDGADLGVRVRYSWEQPVLVRPAARGAPCRSLTDDDDDDFLIVNGDTLTDLDSGALVARAPCLRRPGDDGADPEPAAGQYGGVLRRRRTGGSPDSRAAAAAPARRPTYHFIGVQVAEARAFAGARRRRAGRIGQHSLSAADRRRRPRSIAALRVRRQLSSTSARRATTCETTLRSPRRERATARSARARRSHASAALERTAVWDDVSVGAGASLLDCVVGDGVAIPRGSSFERCAIVPAAGRSRAATSGSRAICCSDAL